MCIFVRDDWVCGHFLKSKGRKIKSFYVFPLGVTEQTELTLKSYAGENIFEYQEFQLLI